MIDVQAVGGGEWQGTVSNQTTTTHIVTVPDAYYQKLTGGRVEVEKLLKASFDFLLEREPNTSILREFELTVISRYFPEYETTIVDAF